MSKPLTVSLPHSLGREEAKRRIQQGMGQAQASLGNGLAKIEAPWTGDRMDLKLGVMGQSVTGHVEVLDETVRLEVHLPWALRLFAEKARGVIESQGRLMLEKK